jgi:hypothetical protein
MGKLAPDQRIIGRMSGSGTEMAIGGGKRPAIALRRGAQIEPGKCERERRIAMKGESARMTRPRIGKGAGRAFLRNGQQDAMRGGAGKRESGHEKANAERGQPRKERTRRGTLS